MADPAPLVLRVFVSSPGDVAEERASALQVLRGLAHEPWARGRFVMQPVLWDDPDAPVPMDARSTPQASVNADKGLPADCDLTIVVLWSRIGSPPALRGDDGQRWASGTEWEFDNALGARRPVWVYRRIDKPTIEIDDPAAEEKREQYRAVQRFFDRFKAADGSLTSGCSTYRGAAGFGVLLRQQLTAFVARRLAAAEAKAPRAAVPAPAPVPPYLMPAITRGHAVVGRSAALADAWRVLAGGHFCCLVLAPGIGKTTAAIELVADRARMLEHFEGVLWADIGSRPDVAQQLRRWAEALGVAAERLAAMTSIDDWKALVRGAIGERRLLLVLDDVWTPEHSREFGSLGARCVCLVTTRSRPVANELARQDYTIELGELAEADALVLLRDIAPHAVEADPRATRALIAAVQGLPLALVLMGRYLKRESGDRDPDRIGEAFDMLARIGVPQQMQGEDRRNIEQIIDVSVAALRTDRARRSLEHLSIFRPKPHAFTKEMAREICTATSDTLYELSDVGLLEHRGGGNYSMHRIVCDYARARLQRPQRLRLHRKALDWYGSKLHEGVAGEPQAYADWYRCEQADWQALKDAWLHHLASSGDARASSLAFLRVYFDAFWWWGYYQRFPFCERLIQEWSMRDIGAEQRNALALLREFQQAYPAGREKRVERGRWLRIERALRSLLCAAGLDGDPARLDGDDARQLRAFIDFFRAEAIAYGRGDRPRALARYQAAYDGFVASGGSWQGAWVLFYVGQYLLDAGDPAGAAEHAARSQAELDRTPPLTEGDPELPANNHRLMGAARLAVGDARGALVHYRKALFFAFMFQAFPQPADTYTVSFYREICGRIAASLLEQRAHDPATATALAEALHDFWAPWWQRHGAPDRQALHGALAAGDAAALEAACCPALPTDLHLRERAMAYSHEVRLVFDALRGAAEVDAGPAAD